jgi:hypothetical protein
MSLLKQLQSKWGGGGATLATIATVDLLQKPSVAKVASVASSHEGGNTQSHLKPRVFTALLRASKFVQGTISFKNFCTTINEYDI